GFLDDFMRITNPKSSLRSQQPTSCGRMLATRKQFCGLKSSRAKTGTAVSSSGQDVLKNSSTIEVTKSLSFSAAYALSPREEPCVCDRSDPLKSCGFQPITIRNLRRG